MADLADLKISDLAYNAMTDYLYHKDKTLLLKVLEEHPEELADSKLFRDFVLDFVRAGNPKSRHQQFKKETAEIANKAFSEMCFYRGIGYPVQPNEYTKESGLSCSQLAGRAVGKSGWTVYKQYFKKRNLYKKVEKGSGFLHLKGQATNSYLFNKGRAIRYLNNGVIPDTFADLQALIDKFEALTEYEQGELIEESHKQAAAKG